MLQPTTKPSSPLLHSHTQDSPTLFKHGPASQWRYVVTDLILNPPTLCVWHKHALNPQFWRHQLHDTLALPPLPAVPWWFNAAESLKVKKTWIHHGSGRLLLARQLNSWHSGTIIFVSNMKDGNVRAGPGAGLQRALWSPAGDLSL